MFLCIPSTKRRFGIFEGYNIFEGSAPIIDWDKVSSKQEAEPLYESILSCDRIYFIDRTETVDGKLKVYPVKKWKPAMY